MNMNIKFSKKSVWDVAGGTATDDGVASRGIKKRKGKKNGVATEREKEGESRREQQSLAAT